MTFSWAYFQTKEPGNARNEAVFLNDSFLLEFGSWCKEQIFVLSESWRENREL